MRARVVETVPGWWGWVLVGAGLLAVSPVWGQSAVVPEAVRPRSDSPVLPPAPGGEPLTPPRSENPLAQDGGTRPVPDGGVIAPPVSGMGSTTVIRPPATGGMPVIAPPGTPGGAPGVVPK